MYPDPYRDLAVAYHHLTRRPPDWVRDPALAGFGDLDGIVAAIRNDCPDSSSSDTVLRMLAAIAQHDGRAATVVLFALAAELRRRVSRAATAEYRSDALGELASIILEGDDSCAGLGHRYVNRAHNRTNKHHHRVRHHGQAIPATVDPLPTDRVIEYRDRTPGWTDIADAVACRVDLERFRAAVDTAVACGDLTEKAWRTYADHRLRVLYEPDRCPVPTRQRVAAYRAGIKLQPIIEVHLRAHAA